MSKKLTAIQSKKLWIKIVDEMVYPTWNNVDISSTIEKLKKVKFTYGGNMRQILKSGRQCKYYKMARFSFSSLYKEWKKQKQELESK